MWAVVALETSCGRPVMGINRLTVTPLELGLGLLVMDKAVGGPSLVTAIMSVGLSRFAISGNCMDGAIIRMCSVAREMRMLSGSIVGRKPSVSTRLMGKFYPVKS